MKKLLLFGCLLLLCGASFANHITGGEMYYELKSQSGNDYTYEITLKLFRDCNAPSGSAQLDPSVIIGIYNKGTNTLAQPVSNVAQSRFEKQNLGTPNPCISNPPIVCYEVGYYTFTATLPGIPSGYIISYQRCCRITFINNIVPNSGCLCQ
jgi:hypothetical protein